MTTEQEATIRDLARRVVDKGITVDITQFGVPYATAHVFKGYEYRPRRVAMLLKAHGIPAKANWKCDFIRAFTKFERERITEQCNEHRAYMAKLNAEVFA